MRKVLLIVGIVLVVLGLISFVVSGFNRYMNYHTLDGSAKLYERFRHNMRVYFWDGPMR